MINKYDILAIYELVPNARFEFIGNDLNWKDDRECPSKQLLEKTKQELIEKDRIVELKNSIKILLANSDWAETSTSQMLLENGNEWIDYRIQLKKILININLNQSIPKKPEVKWK